MDIIMFYMDIILFFFSLCLVISLSLPHFSKRAIPETISYLEVFFSFQYFEYFITLLQCVRFLLRNVFMGMLLCTHKCGYHLKPTQTVLAKSREQEPPKLLVGV